MPMKNCAAQMISAGGAGLDHAGDREGRGQQQRPEDRGAEQADLLAQLPADNRGHHHQRDLVQRHIACGGARRVRQIQIVDQRQQEGRDGHDDQHPGRMDQAHGAHVTAGLFAEDQHVLQSARHRRIERGRVIEAHHLADNVYVCFGIKQRNISEPGIIN
jgi:hypothetical protein